MNKIVNKFLSTDDIFMPEMHLKQPGFTYSACRPFTTNQERIQKFKETEDTNYIQKNKLDKACFQHDKAYGDFKDLKRRTAFDKVLRDKAFNIAKSPEYDGYQRGLASMVYKFFDKNLTGSGVPTLANKFAVDNNKTKQNLQLAEKLHEPIIRNFKKRTIHFGFKDNI